MVIYTVPPGETAIIKSLGVTNLNASTTVVVFILIDAGAFNQTTFERLTLAPAAHAYRDWWIVLPPGAEVAIQLTEAVGVNFWLSGTELEGVAD